MQNHILERIKELLGFKPKERTSMDCKVWLYHSIKCPNAIKVEQGENPCVDCKRFVKYGL